MQYQKHPIDTALEALAPILAPSFTLRSSRDGENIVRKYPLIDYTIVGAQGKTYDPSKNQWRSNYLVILEILVEERKPLSWCQYPELAQAQDRHALFFLLEQMIEQLITLLVNPKKVSNLISPFDTIYSELDFKLVNFIGSQNKFKQGGDETTGVVANFVLSSIDPDGGACCLIDYNNVNQLQELRDLMVLGSNSWNLLNNASGGTPQDYCDILLSKLSQTTLLTCILPTYNFAQTATQNALSVQQILDLATWLLPQYDFADVVWQNLLTAQQESDLTNYLLPLVDFSDVNIQAIITPQQQSDLIAWLLPLVDFSDPAIQAIVTPTQQTDLQNWLCTTPSLPRYSTTFDGINESVASSYSPFHELDRSDPFTIDVWVKPTSYTIGAIVGKFDYQGTRRGWVIWTINSGSVVFELASNESTGNTVTTITVAKIPLNTWTRITVTYTGNSNASGVLMYLDKVSTPYTIFQNALTGTTVDATNIIQCGGDAPAYFAGRIYEAMVYKNRVLTPAEIAALPTVTDTPQYEADLIYWNKLGQGSIFGETVRVYPDYTNIASGFQSRNMELADLSTDIPT